VISVENRKMFPPPVYIAPPLKWELGTGAGSQKLEWCAIGQKRKFDDIFSHMDTIHQGDRRTDRRTADDNKDRAYA